MGQLAKIRLTQNHANVRMCDKQSTLVDHIGNARFTDLHARNHVPNKFEIDFSDSDASTAAGAGNRKGEVGFRFLAEIDWTQIALFVFGLDELRLLTQV